MNRLMKDKISRALLTAFSVLLFALLLSCSDVTASAALSSLTVAATKVIPGLFIFITLSVFMTKMSVLEPLGGLIPTEKLFSLPRASASAIITGLLCGFPVGAVCVSRLVRDGRLTLDEAAICLALSSAPSPAFLLSVVGGAWSSRGFGVLLYAASVLSVFLFGMIYARTRKPGSLSRVTDATPGHGSVRFSRALCEAVSDASVTCLRIAAYITFFSSLASCASYYFPQLRALIMPVFEFSSGALCGAEVGGVFGGAVTGFSVGFSSLSVFAQTAYAVSDSDIPLGCFFLSKLVSGTVCALCGAVSAYFLAPSAVKDAFLPAATASPLISAAVLAALSVLYGITRFYDRSTYNAKSN